MKVVNEKPPIWASVKELFDFDEKTTVFTYGDTIYNPAGVHISDDVIAHEMVHYRQQSALNIWGHFGPVRWWKRFLYEPEFRMEQELEAYKAQYQYVRTRGINREALNKFLVGLAYKLSGNMYGNVIGFNEALRRIKKI